MGLLKVVGDGSFRPTPAVPRWFRVFLFLFVFSGGSGALRAAAPSLRAAEAAFDDHRYDEVIPLLKTARTEKPSLAERLRMAELAAFVHVIFDRMPKARRAFRRALSMDPSYEPPVGTSPKILKVFEAARSRSPARRPAAPAPPRKETRKKDAVTTAESEQDADVQDRADEQDFEIPPPMATASTESASPFYQRWWFWTAVTVGVASIAVVTAVALQSDEPKHDFGPFPLP